MRLTLRSGFSRSRAARLATAEALAQHCTNSRICDASVLRRFALPSPPASSIMRRQYEKNGRDGNSRVLAVSQSICQTSEREQAAGNVGKQAADRCQKHSFTYCGKAVTYRGNSLSITNTIDANDGPLSKTRTRMSGKSLSNSITHARSRTSGGPLSNTKNTYSG